MKWQSISTCLDLSWNVGFLERCMADWLSQNTNAKSIVTAKSLSKATIQVISLATAVRDLYSASAKDLESVACFLDCQDSREVLRKTQNPVVDRLMSMQLHQHILLSSSRMLMRKICLIHNWSWGISKDGAGHSDEGLWERTYIGSICGLHKQYRAEK